MTELIEIGENMTLLRNAQGLTQEEVAFRSNRSVNCLQTIEYGNSNATIDTLIRIAKALGVDARVLGCFSRSDQTILSEIHRAPRLPVRPGGDLQICENIFLLRKEKGWTQKHLATLSGISVAYLRDIEHGCANVTVYKLFHIANAFALSLSKLSSLSMSENMMMDLVHTARDRAGIGSA